MFVDNFASTSKQKWFSSVKWHMDSSTTPQLSTSEYSLLELLSLIKHETLLYNSKISKPCLPDEKIELLNYFVFQKTTAVD